MLPEAEREMILFTRFQEKERNRIRNEIKAKNEGRTFDSESQQRKGEPSTSKNRNIKSSQEKNNLKESQSKQAKALSDLSSKRKQSQQSSKVETPKEQPKPKSDKPKEIINLPDDAPFELIKAATFTRHRLVKYIFEPYFEEMVIGSFVRILLGENEDSKKIYRLVRITGVSDSKPYQTEDKGRFVNVSKVLTLACGTEMTRGISKISNDEPMETEYGFWKKMTRSKNGLVPKSQEIKDKLTQIAKLTKTYMYTKSDIEKMTKERRIRLEELDLSSLFKLKVDTSNARKLTTDLAELDRLDKQISEYDRAIKAKNEAMLRNRIPVYNINRKNLEKNLSYESPKTQSSVVSTASDPFQRINSDSSFFDSKRVNDTNTIIENIKKVEPVRAQLSKLSVPDPKSKVTDIHSFDIGIDFNELPSPTISSSSILHSNVDISRKRERDPSGLTLQDYQSKRLKTDKA